MSLGYADFLRLDLFDYSFKSILQIEYQILKYTFVWQYVIILTTNIVGSVSGTGLEQCL